VRVLAVFAHPKRQSFTGTLLDALLRGLDEAGHAVELADLHAEGFDPRFGAADFAQFEPGGRMPEAIRREQARLDRTDGLALVFPIYWWSFPALLKGWIDRVWSQGWAYDFAPARSRGLMADRPVALLGSAGSRASTYRRYGYDRAMTTAIDVGILGYCGLTNVATSIFHDVNDDPAILAAHLAEARRIGRDFGAWPRPEPMKPGPERANGPP
jgi:NAD(P)H dehydrogenase (quinone)